MLPMTAIVLLALAGIGSLLHVVAAFRLAAFLRRCPAQNRSTPPLTFWRALKPRVPDLRAKLDALTTSSRPRLTARCSLPSWIHLAPHAVQNALRWGLTTMTIRGDSHTGHRAISPDSLLTPKAESRRPPSVAGPSVPGPFWTKTRWGCGMRSAW